ncbi:Zinc finger, PMZ-type [Sesbania bispinosa]|nr:Zinc finger, PMZ-type [Sesbania bispinosa]
MYDCRTKWATAYFRGNFFAGFRTTSRCESLHSELGKHVHSRYNMTDFLQHYHRCVSHMRFREIEDEFSCLHGQPVLQSSFPSLEKSASKYYTKRIFSLFCIVLDKVSGMTVIGCTEVLMYLIYTVRKITSGKEWRVSYYPSTCNLKCSCLMMESRGLPCEHILAVLVHLNIEELPSSLVLKRWTKFASEGFRSHTGDSINYLDPSFLGRWAVLVDMYVGMSELQADTNENFDETREKVWQEFEELKARKVAQLGTSSSSMQGNDEIVRDPVRASTKGRGPPLNSSRGLRVKRKTRCSYCKLTGHNKTTCSQRMRDTQPTDTTCEGSVQFGAEIPFTPSMQNDDASFNVH